MAKNIAEPNSDLNKRDLFSIPGNDTNKNDADTDLVDGKTVDEPGVNKNDPPNKQNQDRFEYWQSQSTQKDAELEKFKTFAPVVEYLEKNPQVIKALELHLNGELEVKPDPKVKEAELVAPIRPTKPSGYNPFDADPESLSYKYREDMDIYQDAKDEYRDKLLVKELSPYKQTLEQSRLAKEEFIQDQSTVAHLVTNKKWDEGKAKGFIQFAKDPRSLEQLPEYYEFVLAREKAKTATPPDSKKTIVDPKKKDSTNPPPVPPTGGNGVGDNTDANKNQGGFDRSKNLFARSKI
jgi:hypothetical protein